MMRIGKTLRRLKPPAGSPATTGSETLDARRHARTLKEFYGCRGRDELKPLVRTAIILGEEVDRLREAIKLTISQNGHLADGDTCTLKLLKQALSPNAEVSEGGTRDSRIETAAQSPPFAAPTC